MEVDGWSKYLVTCTITPSNIVVFRKVGGKLVPFAWKGCLVKGVNSHRKTFPKNWGAKEHQFTSKRAEDMFRDCNFASLIVKTQQLILRSGSLV